MRQEIAQIIKKDKAMELFYGNNSNPRELLGRHMVRGGQVISSYHPDAVAMKVIDHKGREYIMDPIERLPVYAVFIPTSKEFPYQVEMNFKDGNTYLCEDPYSFTPIITEQEEKEFLRGEWKEIYYKLGATPMKINGVDGVHFAVWAPNARRVSIVGDFNFWNGMIYPMQRLNESGIFELFLPRVKEKALYKFEIKSMDGSIFHRLDPYGITNLDGNKDTSIVLNMKDFKWTDAQWMRDRKNRKWCDMPLSICDHDFSDDSVKDFIDKNCFTHVLLKPPTYCHALRGKIREWINDLHRRGIGVLIQLSLNYFSDEDSGLKQFDGTSLFGYSDERIHYETNRKMFRFNHGRNEVCNYLISCLMTWMKDYHIDGFVFEGVSDMLKVRYTTNIGGKLEDKVIYRPETEEFLVRTVRALRKLDADILIISDEEEEVRKTNDQLLYSRIGFDGLINYSVPANLSSYICGSLNSPGKDYHKLALPLMKSGLSDTIVNLVLRTSSEEHYFLQDVIVNEFERLSWKKLTAGYLLGVPGRKRWSWKNQASPEMEDYLKDLFRIYGEHSCMYSYDEKKPSFVWINGMDARNQVLSFVRRSESRNKNLLFVCNFNSERRESFQIGVPRYGQYRMILNSDWNQYGGSTRHDENVYDAIAQPWDLQPYSVRVTVPGLSVLVFEY